MKSQQPGPSELLPLHPLEFRILVALLDGARHGYDIVKEIEARADQTRRVFPANLYRRIRSLRTKGLLEHTGGPLSDAARPRHYFRLTALGRTVITEEARRLEALLDEVRPLLGEAAP